MASGCREKRSNRCAQHKYHELIRDHRAEVYFTQEELRLVDLAACAMKSPRRNFLRAAAVQCATMVLDQTPQCRRCGDAEFGPWLYRDGRMVCEGCDAELTLIERRKRAPDAGKDL